MSEWSHLANAKHIDLIIAHVKANPAAWYAAGGWFGGSKDVGWNAAWYAAKWAVNCGRSMASAAALQTATVAMPAARNSVYDAILALVAWDHAGGLMDSPAEQVKVLAILGDQAALLMYPAIAVMETTQELA
jgi:hypothetical protein